MAYGSFGVLFTGYSPDAHPRYLDYIGFRLERKEEGSKIEEQAMLSQMVRKTGGRRRCEKIPPGFRACLDFGRYVENRQFFV